MNVFNIRKKNKSAILGKRALSVTDAYHNIWLDIAGNYLDFEIVDLFFDDTDGTQERYAILMDGSDRQLYRLDFVVTDNAVLYPTPLTAVNIEFMETQRVSTVQSDDSRMILLVQSANAIPTRDGYHDVRSLLESFVRIEDSTNIRPMVDVFHNELPIGRVIDSFIHDGGYSLFDLVELDENPTSRFIYNEIEKGVRSWGASNQFISTRKHTEILDGKEIKVLDGNGIRHFVSLLPENMVANYDTMTTIVETKDSNNMSRDLEGFLQSAIKSGADQALIDELSKLIDNRAAETAMHENKRSAEVAEPVAEVAPVEIVAEVASDVQLDAQDVAEIVDIVDGIETVDSVEENDEDISESDSPVAENDPITDEEIGAFAFAFATKEDIDALNSKFDSVISLQSELAEARQAQNETRSLLDSKDVAIATFQAELDQLKGQVKGLRAIEAFIQSNRSKRQRNAQPAVVVAPVVDVVAQQVQTQKPIKNDNYPAGWGQR